MRHKADASTTSDDRAGGAGASLLSPVVDDNKYDKIRQQQNQFRRSVLVLGLIATFALGALQLWTSNTNSMVSSPVLSSASSSSSLKINKSVPEKDVSSGSISDSGGSGDDDEDEEMDEGDTEEDEEEEEEAEDSDEQFGHNTVGPSEQQLQAAFTSLEDQVRQIKATGVIMEKDAHSLEMTGRLQEAAHALLLKRYGKPPYQLKINLEFQDSSKTGPVNDSNRYDSILIEMAPISLVPYSVLNFLEIARGYQKGGFHRNAGHVLQATINTAFIKKPLAFQEYSPQYPHVKGTVGYCGRPSSVCWYISIQDNTHVHGPGSQQDENPYEADANWGRVIQGMEDVVPRIHKTMPGNGFLNNKKDWVLVTSMTILVKEKGGDGDDGEFTEWKPKPQLEPSE